MAAYAVQQLKACTNSNTRLMQTTVSIASGSNAMSAGPITIDTGNSVTVPTGSTWVIV